MIPQHKKDAHGSALNSDSWQVFIKLGTRGYVMLDIPVRAVFIKLEVLNAAACLLENMGIAIFKFVNPC